MESREEEVVIVGAGVIGLATALALLQAGRGVRVIDAGRIGGGSSHGNCGTITPSHAPPLAAPGTPALALGWMLTPDAPLYIPPRLDPGLWRWLMRFAGRCNARDWQASALAKSALLNDSRDRVAAWIDDHHLACEFSPSGLDYVYRDPRGFAAGLDHVESLRGLGIGVEVVEGAEYERLEPALKPGVAGAVRFQGDAALRPDRYVAELARVVVERGGVIQEHCALQSLQDSGVGMRLETASGVLHARQVVLALGAWSNQLCSMVGVPALGRAIQPGKGYSITYSAPQLVPQRPLVLREKSVCVTAWDSGFRLGSTMEFSGFDTSLNARRLAALERGAAEYLHQPVGPELRERWYGWRPMCCDDIPIIGPVPGRDGLWLATGHGMMGMGMSAGTGQLVADLMAGREPAIDPRPYRVERFG
ncbi:MAG: FAD-dependent oxidoreductase [Pseudomonadota bacterium]|nr:FAD-dependent oxidoreductase [Pseudomonadota bacterium]